MTLESKIIALVTLVAFGTFSFADVRRARLTAETAPRSPEAKLLRYVDMALIHSINTLPQAGTQRQRERVAAIKLRRYLEEQVALAVAV